MLAVSSTLPAENPENLARPWKQAAPREAPPQDEAAPAASAAARLEGDHQSGCRSTAGGRAAGPDRRAGGASVHRLHPARCRNPRRKREAVVIQAGSFKNKENADKARTTLAALAPVEVTPIEVGGNVYFRVRVGPFAAAAETEVGSGQGQERRISGRQDRRRELSASFPATGLIFDPESLIFAGGRPLGSGRNIPLRSGPVISRVRLAP